MVSEKLIISRKIKENINMLIQNGDLKEAEALLTEYKNIDKCDIEIYSIEAVISITKGKLDNAKNIINDGLLIDKNNFDLNYNLGYVCEQNGEYLKALETYEGIVFNMEDTEKRQQIIEHLNKLENENREEIQKQLEDRDNNMEDKSFNGKKINLHLMYDSQYCNEFIHFVNENFPMNEHKFIVIHNRNEKLKLMNVDGVNNVEILDLSYELNKLFYYIENCSRVFIHYLMDYFCEIVCRFNINKPIYWPLWGGDLYNYIDIEMYQPKTKELLKNLGYKINSKINKNTIEYVYRKSVTRKIRCILTLNNKDYEKVKKNFITNAELKPFFYHNPIDFFPLSNNLNKDISNKYNDKIYKFKYVILVGNSANPSNNHVDILQQLYDMKLKDFCVVMPLSYGGQQLYIDAVINEGKRLLGEKFIPITEYLNSKEYFSILKQVDVAVFNHNRQQAVGNIVVLLYMDKKVYLNNKVSTFSWLKDLNINVQDVNKVKNNNIFKYEQSENKNRLIDNLNDKKCIEHLINIFN